MFLTKGNLVPITPFLCLATLKINCYHPFIIVYHINIARLVSPYVRVHGCNCCGHHAVSRQCNAPERPALQFGRPPLQHRHSADYVKSLQFINNGVVTVGKYAHVLKAVRIISSTMCAIGFDRTSTRFKFLKLFFSTGP